MSPVLRSDAALSGSQNEALSRCEQAVLSCFPDICREYLKTEAAKHGWDSQRVISHILDEQETGRPTPKQPNPLKRKRPEKDEEGVDEARKRFERADPRLARKGREYVRLHTKAA
jgi:TRIAD3 protein (E3 ubiquitin-protein ligase RNF216)